MALALEPAELSVTTLLHTSCALLASLLLLSCALRTRGDSKPPPGEACPEAAEDVITEDADACWVRQFGRFKHCGLRPNPTEEGSRPPEYSLEPLELPLPELSAKEAACLNQLAGRVQDLAGRHRTDPATLLRFLQARKFDVAQSEKYFRGAAKWREERGVDEALTKWNLEAYEECLAPWWLSGGFLGHGRNGEMLAYERCATCNFPLLMQKLPFEELEKLDIVHCMRSLAAVEEDAMRRGLWMGNGILIEDCEGYSFDQVSLSAAKAYNRLIVNRNQIMPECLTKILIIRAPAAFVYAWKMFSPILDPGIREKVQVAGGSEGTLNLLLKYIDKEEIPAFLGGEREVEGDPQCRKVLAPGGVMPDGAVQRFLKMRHRRRGESSPDADEEMEAFPPWAACVAREPEGLVERRNARQCCG